MNDRVCVCIHFNAMFYDSACWTLLFSVHFTFMKEQRKEEMRRQGEGMEMKLCNSKKNNMKNEKQHFIVSDSEKKCTRGGSIHMSSSKNN